MHRLGSYGNTVCTQIKCCVSNVLFINRVLLRIRLGRKWEPDPSQGKMRLRILTYKMQIGELDETSALGYDHNYAVRSAAIEGGADMESIVATYFP